MVDGGGGKCEGLCDKSWSLFNKIDQIRCVSMMVGSNVGICSESVVVRSEGRMQCVI